MISNSEFYHDNAHLEVENLNYKVNNRVIVTMDGIKHNLSIEDAKYLFGQLEEQILPIEETRSYLEEKISELEEAVEEKEEQLVNYRLGYTA